MDILEAVNKVLSPLQDFTDALSGEQYVNVSYLKPVLFNTSSLAEEESDTQPTKDVNWNILAYLNEKYSDQVTGDMLDIASPFDTRFRTMYMDKEKVEQVLSRAAEEIVSLIKAQQDTLSGAAGAAAEAEPFLLLRKKKKKDFGQLFQKAEHHCHLPQGRTQTRCCGPSGFPGLKCVNVEMCDYCFYYTG